MGPERPSAGGSIPPPPPEDLRHVDRLATIGRLAAGAVHELATVLGVASIHTDAIASGEVTGEEARASARVVGLHLERLSTRIRGILEFAREAPLAPSQRERRDVRAIARRAAELLVRVAARRGITLRMDGGDPLEADVDDSQIEQVVTNLVLNGIQACLPGGNVHVSVLAAPESDEIVIDVRDDGVGIATTNLFRIFEPFFTTRPAGEGMGLGLSVAEEIVRDHGGWIDVESEPGKGSCFRVHLNRPPAEGM